MDFNLTTTNQPLGYFNDRLLPIDQLSLPIDDLGLVHGVIVAERVRTLAGKSFLLQQHFARWCHGLQLLDIPAPLTLETLIARIDELIDLNGKLLQPGAPQGICFLATPGSSGLGWNEISINPKSSKSSAQPVFIAYTYPLPVSVHRLNYEHGIALQSTSITDVSEHSWPRSVKIRSRLHYYLAAAEATQRSRQLSQESRRFHPPSDIGAPCDSPTEQTFPVLLDQEGYVSDSSTASIAGWSEREGLIVRPANDRYASVSLDFLVNLCRTIGMRVTERYYTIDELKRFDEAFLVSTPWCLYPVRTVDEHQFDCVDDGFAVFQKLLHAWEDTVGCKL